MCSTGHYWSAQWEIIMCLTGHYWCAQWGSIFAAPWEISGVHIVVVVNNIPNVKPAVIYMPFKSTLPHEFDAWFLHGRMLLDLIPPGTPSGSYVIKSSSHTLTLQPHSY